jgi:hypothetical protein
MTTAIFSCPGLAMPQPPDAPSEGYLACYRAGHDCGFETTVVETEMHITTTGRCPCCGDFKWQIGQLRTWDEFPEVSR